MARRAGLATAAVTVLALGACGKSNQSTTSNAAQPTAAAPSAPALTDAQKKTLLAGLPAAYQGADLSNGEAKFAVCQACHTIVQGGADMTGPNLWGIFGRKAGSEATFTYSDDLKNAGWAWDADHLDKWITNPKTVLNGTKMTFVGVADAGDRRDIIAYLKVSTSPPPPS
jgi:cytochrome c